jgi:predicted  nucleic acid-binding Zn-ribbon protein
LTINEAVELSGIAMDVFYEKYIHGGIISTQVEDGVRRIELSEFIRVFPNARLETNKLDEDIFVDNQLKQLKIDNLEHQIAHLQRQLDKQLEDYHWLRDKFDNTTLLLEQKMDTSEVDKYKQEIRQLSQLAMQWEKKYNTLLAANELKALLKENRDLKQKLDGQANEQSVAKVKLPSQVNHITQSNEIIKPKRRKIFGIF